MHAIFVESPAFERNRERYLDDNEFRVLQSLLMTNPEAGDVIAGTGGLRKLRFPDARRSKGRRGGLRIVYYFWVSGTEIWLFTLYDKDETSDLTATQRNSFRVHLKTELKARSKA